MAVGIERVDGTRRLVVSRTVPAPAEVVWDLLVDTDRWPTWGPSVRAVESDHRYIQHGTTGRIETPLGLTLPFEITEYGEFHWTWRVARIPATGHRVEALGPDRCRVSFDLPVVAVGYVPVCERALSRIESLAIEDRS